MVLMGILVNILLKYIILEIEFQVFFKRFLMFLSDFVIQNPKFSSQVFADKLADIFFEDIN